jgi:hypothetical protein
MSYVFGEDNVSEMDMPPTRAQLIAENAALHDMLSEERQNNDDLRAALDTLAAPVIARIAGRIDPHMMDCEGGLIDQTQLKG